MTYTYKLLGNHTGPGIPANTPIDYVLRKEDNLMIPKNEENTDYQEYLAWIAEGNTPEAAD